MYQKFPLDLNMHSTEVSNLQSDFKDIGLQLQAQRATGTQAFFFDAYSVKAAVPSSVVAAALPVGVAIQGAYDYPFQAVYDDSILLRRQQLHYLHQHQQQQQKPHDQLQIQQHQLELNHAASYMDSWQQQQRQQLEKRGCWFPNWQEVFQGFPGSKEDKQGMLSSFQHQPTERDSVKVASVASTVGFKKAQQLNVRPDNGEVLNVRPFSPHLRSHATTTSLYGNVPELHDWHSDRAGTNGLSEHGTAFSHLATAIVPCNASSQEKRNENVLVPFTDVRDPSLPSSTGDIACRYITQSPAWLPKGWITEVQTRRTGTTAGTRDKYYKDLVSGRRFRSRNEVIHFLQTGKGRHRRRRHRRAIASSAFGSHVNLLTHGPQPLTQQDTSAPCVFLAPQPIGFVLGPLVNRQAVHSQPSMPHAVAQEVESSCQTPAANADVSSTPCANHQSEEQSPRVMFGLKRPVESRPQKSSPVHKKAKIMSPKKCEDKQASRLWQWLHKPAARTDDQPQRQDAQKQVNMAEEKKAPDIQDLGRQVPSMQNAAQLSRDIEVAQRTITQIGKEMQATIERLTQRVQTAQRDLKLEADITHKADNAMNIVMQATGRLDSAVGNLTEATQSLVFVLRSAMHASEAHTFKVGTTLPAEQLQAAATGVVQRALQPEVAMVQSASSSHAASAIERTDDLRGNAMQARMRHNAANTYANVLRPDNSRACMTQEAQLPDVFVRYSEPSHWPDNQAACITQAAQFSHVLAHYAIQQAQRPDLAMCTPTKIPRSSIIAANYTSTQATTTGIVIDATGTTSNAEKLRGDENAYQKASELSKQIMETRSLHFDKFSALNPELDLSLLNPSLSSRQRAKEVQKMKAKHARGLLVILGRKLCYEAIRKCGEDD